MFCIEIPRICRPCFTHLSTAWPSSCLYTSKVVKSRKRMSLKQPPNGSDSRPRSVSLSPTDNKKERFKKLGVVAGTVGTMRKSWSWDGGRGGTRTKSSLYPFARMPETLPPWSLIQPPTIPASTSCTFHVYLCTSGWEGGLMPLDGASSSLVMAIPHWSFLYHSGWGWGGWYAAMERSLLQR